MLRPMVVGPLKWGPADIVEISRMSLRSGRQVTLQQRSLGVASPDTNLPVVPDACCVMVFLHV